MAILPVSNFHIVTLKLTVILTQTTEVKNEKMYHTDIQMGMLKMQEWNSQEWNTWEKPAEMENAGDCAENMGVENTRNDCSGFFGETKFSIFLSHCSLILHAPII